MSTNPTRINTFTPNIQALPAFASLSNGGFVAVWVSYEQGENISGIYFQQYNSDGIPSGPETGVNITSYIYQHDVHSSVVGLKDGGFVIAYDGHYGAQFQIYTDQGTPKGQLGNIASQFSTPGGNSGGFGPYPDSLTSIAALKDGGFVITYLNLLGSVAARIFDSNGKAKGDEFSVLKTDVFLGYWDPAIDYAEVTALSNGSFVIAWTERMFGESKYDVFLRHYDENGIASANPLRIYDIPTGSYHPSITALKNGMYALTWESGIGIYVQVYSNLDLPVTEKILITDNNLKTSEDIDQHAIDSLPNGGFVILREDYYEKSDGSSEYKVVVQKFASNGQKSGGEIDVITSPYNLNGFRDVTIKVLEDGGFIIGWRKENNNDLNFDIYAKRYNADGNEIPLLHENNVTWEPPTNGVMTKALLADKIKIMADFSKAAYNLKSWENLGINNVKLFSDQAMDELGINSQEGWHSFPFSPQYKLSSTEYDGHIVFNQIEDGLYVNGNAAALVARSNDAIVISFRGTNDNENYSSSISPDQKDWLNMTRHYDLMRPLADALDVYIEMNGIKNVYVTGHSLGGAMAIKYMDDHVNGFKGADYESVVFGSASYSLYGTYDNRMTLIEIEGDAVADTGGFNGRNIHFVGNQTSGSSTAYHSMDYYRQMVDSVDNLSWEQILKENGDQYIYIGGRMLNTDSFIVDGKRSGFNSIYDNGNDALIDPLLSDYDIYYGGRGNDKLQGGSDSELMLGSSGNDELIGMGNADRLFGGTGNDILNGGGGGDFLYGGTGNDVYSIDNINDLITEKANEGTDSINSNITYSLSDNLENLSLIGTSIINGTGNVQANVITGNSSANQLNGWAGNDNLNGNAGNDILIGGIGTNILIGGIGKDIYRFNNLNHIDTINDYSIIDDTIQLISTVYSALTTKGVLPVGQFRIGSNALDNNDYVIYNKNTGGLLYDSDANGAVIPIKIATIGVGLNMTNADIVIV